MSYTFLEFAVEVIKMQNNPMSVYETWNKAKELVFDSKLSKYDKTPEQMLGARIIDRLCEENKDFNSFVHTITSDLAGDEMRNSNDFDTVFSTDEELQAHVKEKHIG